MMSVSVELPEDATFDEAHQIAVMITSMTGLEAEVEEH